MEFIRDFHIYFIIAVEFYTLGQKTYKSVNYSFALLTFLASFFANTRKNKSHLFPACTGPTTIDQAISLSLVLALTFFQLFARLQKQRESKDENNIAEIRHRIGHSILSLTDKMILSIKLAVETRDDSHRK